MMENVCRAVPLIVQVGTGSNFTGKPGAFDRSMQHHLM